MQKQTGETFHLRPDFSGVDIILPGKPREGDEEKPNDSTEEQGTQPESSETEGSH